MAYDNTDPHPGDSHEALLGGDQGRQADAAALRQDCNRVHWYPRTSVRTATP